MNRFWKSIFRPEVTKADTVSSFSMVWPSIVDEGRLASWNYGKIAREGFSGNSLIYSAISYKARQTSHTPLKAYSGTKTNPKELPDNDPLVELLYRPNKYSSWAEFNALLVVYMNLAGNCYILKYNTDEKTGVPESLIPLRPDKVRIVETKDKKDVNFIYYPQNVGSNEEKVPILYEDMIHIKFPNPADTLDGKGYGLTPIASLAQSGDVDNKISMFLDQFFESGVMVSGLLKTSRSLNEEQTSKIKERWRENYGGVDGWKDIGVVSGDMEFQRIGLTFDEMGFEVLDDRNETRILAPFGVPPILIGSRIGLKSSTYSNYEVARLAFWEDTFIPELRLFSAQFDYHLGDREKGIFLRYDFKGVPALQKDMVHKTEALNRLWNMGVPYNDAVATLSLDFPPIVGGDITYVGAGQVPMIKAGTDPSLVPMTDNTNGSGGVGTITPLQNFAPNATEPEQKPEEEPEEEPSQKALGSDDLLVKELDGRARENEDFLLEGIKNAFNEELETVLSSLYTVKSNNLKLVKSTDYQEIRDVLEVLFSDELVVVWKKILSPYLVTMMNQHLSFWKTKLNKNDESYLNGEEEWFENYLTLIVETILKTNQFVLNKVIDEAEITRRSLDQIISQLEIVYKQWKEGDGVDELFIALAGGFLVFRALNIVRTQTVQFLNLVSTAIFNFYRVDRHKWFTQLDERVRPTHADAHGQVVKVGDFFKVGEAELLYPLDPYGPPEEVVHCRCFTIPA